MSIQPAHSADREPLMRVPLGHEMRMELILVVGLLVLCIGCKREPASETEAPVEHQRVERPARGQHSEQEEAHQDVAATDDGGDILYVDGYVDFDLFPETDYSLGLTDEQLEEMRDKLKEIHFPALEGTTARILGLPESKLRSFGDHIYASIIPLGDEWECAHYGRRFWVLNSRFHLILAGGYYFNAHSDPMTLETGALITEDTSHESAMVKYCFPRSTLSNESVVMAKYSLEPRE